MSNPVESTIYLDQLVAEQVFEEEKPQIPEDVYTGVWDFKQSPKRAWILSVDFDTGDNPEWLPMQFSSVIESAWRIINKIDERFDAVVHLEQVHLPGAKEKVSGWVCSFYERETHKPLGKSLPTPRVEQAICEVALAIVQANKNG